MNRIVVFGFIVAAIGYLVYSNKSIEPIEKGPIVYAESRFTLNVPGREIEMVAIGQRYKTQECLRDSVIQNLNEVCVSNDLCVESKYQCKDDMDSRYTDMLNKEASSTHYVHLQHQTEGLKGVVLVWGLTDAESQQICDQLVQKIEAEKDVSVSAQCI